MPSYSLTPKPSESLRADQRGGEPTCPRLPSAHPWLYWTTERLTITEVFKRYDAMKMHIRETEGERP